MSCVCTIFVTVKITINVFVYLFVSSCFGKCSILSIKLLLFEIIDCFFSVDLNTSAEQVLGMHDDAIKCVEHCPTPGMIT